MRRSLRVLSMLGVMAAATLAVPLPARAAGGCGAHFNPTAGFDIGVCVDDRGSTVTAYPDVWVNESPGASSNCAIVIQVWDDHNNRYGDERSLSCAKGEKPGNATGPFTMPTKVHAYARLDYNGQRYAVGDSPAVALGHPLNDYPWAGLRGTGGDGWGMGYGECVSYVAWKVYQNHGGHQAPANVPAPAWNPGDRQLSPVTFGWDNAGNWDVAAKNAGFRVDTTPRAGAVAQWFYGSDAGQFTVGHVAYVTKVNSDGSIELAQYNLREDGKYSTLHMGRGGATDTSNGHGPFLVTWPDRFLHIHDGS